MTDAERTLQRITEIVRDEIELERHLNEIDADFQEIQFHKADAYRHIAALLIPGSYPGN